MSPDRFRSAGLAFALLPGLFLAGCAHTPPVRQPVLDVPPAFKEAALFMPANPAAADVPDAWWTLFNDPVLNDLQQRLSQGNANLQASAAAVGIAQAAVASSRTALFPTLTVSAGASRAANVSTSPRGTSYALQGGLSGWEIDLWNRVGATVDAATARLQSSQATLAATRLSLQGTLTQTYLALRTAEVQAQVLSRTVQAYGKSLELTQNRYQGGVATAADVALAQTQLKSAQVQAVESRLQRAQLEHALAVLLGQPPAAFQLGAADGVGVDGLPTAPEVPVQLPSSLLERRPDIAAAERQVAAANAQIGAADAAFFPALTLSANGGFRSNDLGALIQSANKFWSLGPSLAYALFDGGGRQAASDSARANHEQTVANYRQTVLAAFQEVEDNLVAAAALQQEAALQEEALAAARRALEIVQNQYKAGTVSYLNVVSAQTSALSAEQTLLNVRNRRLVALGQLLKNLGGRWDRHPIAPETASPLKGAQHPNDG